MPKNKWGPASLPAPTVPSPSILPKQALPRRAVSRGGDQAEIPKNQAPKGQAPKDQARSRFLRGPSKAEASSSFPAGSPSGPKPWRFAIGGFEAEAPLPALAGTSGRSPWFRVRQDPEPKLRFRLASPWTEILGHCRVRSSRAEARSCPTLSKPKPLSDRWRCANRGPAFRRAGPGYEDPVSRLSGSPGPKTLGPDGRFTKHAAFA
jgi:hypothetical protein